RIKGETVDRLLLDELERLKGKQKIEIIELLAERKSVVAVATLFQMARGEDSSLNRAALHALRTCGRVEHMPLVVELLKTHDRSPTFRFVRETLASLAQKSSHSGISGTEVLTVLAQNESPHIRVELIHVMGMVRDPAALEYLEEVFEDSDSDIRLKAYESAIRIAQMSVSRQEDNSEVNSVLQVLSEQTDQPNVRERAKSLLNKKSE
ncbi:MAG: HEAT repeat domain-containing protein, partial [Verrucomicrobia bacterium]|nr:HEAT repeat domain-containing protein [Verrucomicrobiota bacterium]